MLFPKGAARVEVAISYGASERERALYTERLGDRADLIYLQDLDGEARREAARRADVLLGWNPGLDLGGELLSEMRGVRLVQLISAGADHLDPSVFPKDALLCSNAGAYAEPMAEHVLAMALALGKRLLPGHEDLRRGVLDQRTPSRTLRGSAVGIVGYGGIGQAVARLFRALGCPILAINRGGPIEDPVEFQGTLGDLGELFSRSDIVVLTLALTPQTRGLIGKEELSHLREQSSFINVARAAIVDEDALYDHLVEHPKVLAGIDVWWEEPFRGQPFRMRRPFLDLPNVLGSPHNSGVAKGALFGAVDRAAQNVLRFLEGAPLHGLLRREDLFAG